MMRRASSRKYKVKRFEMRKKNSLFLHHDNAPAHSSLLIRDCYAKNHMATLPRLPTHSSDSILADFLLFPELKSPLKCERFTKINENSQTKLRVILETAFQNYI